MHTTYTLVELARLAEHEDFNLTLDEAGVPHSRVPWPRRQKWSKRQEFDARKFDGDFYEKYEATFFKL